MAQDRGLAGFNYNVEEGDAESCTSEKFEAHNNL
jgi:hypothetical protein